MMVSCEAYPAYYAANQDVKDLCECVTGFFRGQQKAITDIYDLFSNEERAMNEALELLEASYTARIAGETPF